MNSHRSFLLLLHYTEPQAEQPLKDCYRTIDKQLYTFLKSVSGIKNNAIHPVSGSAKSICDICKS